MKTNVLEKGPEVFRSLPHAAACLRERRAHPAAGPPRRRDSEGGRAAVSRRFQGVIMEEWLPRR